MALREYMKESQPNVFDGEGVWRDRETEEKESWLQRIERAKQADARGRARENIGKLLTQTHHRYGYLLETEEPVRPAVDEELIAFMLSDLDLR